jgi:hypothetical protein
MDNKDAGFVGKRVKIRADVNEKVFQHMRAMEMKQRKDLKWEDAANELLEKATKHIRL